MLSNGQLAITLPFLLEIAGMVIVVDIIHKTVGLGVSLGFPLCKGLHRCGIKRYFCLRAAFYFTVLRVNLCSYNIPPPYNAGLGDLNLC